MRSKAILLAMIFLFAATPALAQDNPKPGKAQLLARVIGALLDKVGSQLSGDDNEVRPLSVDGTGNTVINIDELVINLNVGDVSIEEEYGNAEEVANRLVDLLMQGQAQREKLRDQQHRGVAVIPPPYSSRIFGNSANNAPLQMNSGWDQQYRQESRTAQAQDKKHEDAGGERPRMRERHGVGGEFWGPAAAGEVESRPHPSPEVMELLMQIPPDVEPEFVEFIMHVGRLAREHPRFRAALEKMVEQAEAHLAEAGAAEHVEHAEDGEHGEAGH